MSSQPQPDPSSEPGTGPRVIQVQQKTKRAQALLPWRKLLQIQTVPESPGQEAVQSTGPGGHGRPAQLPAPPPQGRYLGVSEVDAMVPGIGHAPWKGDHSGSPEAIPADPCGWGSQEAPWSSSPRQGVPSQIKTRAHGRGIWAPLKGKYGFQATWTFFWGNDNASPPKVLPQPFGAKGAGLVSPFSVWETEAQQGKPCLQVWTSPFTPYSFPSEHGSGPGPEMVSQEEHSPLGLWPGRRSQAFSCSPGLGGTDSSMSVLQTHTPGGEPGPSCGRESAAGGRAQPFLCSHTAQPPEPVPML